MTAVDPSPVTLAHRLEREGSPGGQAGCALFLGLLFGVIATLVIRYPITHPEESDAWLIWAVGGGLALLALVLLYSGIHQWLAMKTPETTVEMSETMLTRGRHVRFIFRQPGPVSLQSLRANLVGEETWTVTKRTGSSQRTSYESRYLGTFNFFDSGPHEVDEHRPFEAVVTFLVPADIPASGNTPDDHNVVWKIEVWGRVRGRADFQHPYRVEVG
jgi:hypothetical protein